MYAFTYTRKGRKERYVCMYVCTHVCMSLCLQGTGGMYVFMYACMRVCMYVFIAICYKFYVCRFACACIHAHKTIHYMQRLTVNLYTYMNSICICICIYIYIHTHGEGIVGAGYCGFIGPNVAITSASASHPIFNNNSVHRLSYHPLFHSF
jgi:hypothetical protein